MDPENTSIDRKTYPQKVGQNSRNSLIFVRSQWDLIGSPRPTISSMCQPLATRGKLREYIFNGQKPIHLQHATVHVEVVDGDRPQQTRNYIIPMLPTYGDGIKPSTKACVSMSMARALPIPSPVVSIPIATNKCKACKMREREIM